LGWIGSKPAVFPYVHLAQICTFLYFVFLLLLFPLMAWFEAYFWNLKI